MIANMETDTSSKQEQVKFDVTVHEERKIEYSLMAESTEVSEMIPDDVKSEVLEVISEKTDNEPELKECFEQFQKFMVAWSDHRLAQSQKDLVSFEEKMKAAEKVLSPSSQKVLSSFCEDNKQVMQDCKSDYAFMQSVTGMFDDQEGWTTESIGKMLTTRYKQIPRTALISLKFEGILDIPLINVLTLIYEIDLWNEWIPFLTESRNLRSIHRAAKAVYIKLALPSPLADRDAYLYGFGADNFNEDGSIFILAKSIENEPETLQKHKIDPNSTKKNVKMAVQFAGFRIKPLGPDRCEFIGIANVDPKVTFLPSRVLNWLVRKSTTMLFERMLGKARVLTGTPWEKAIKSPERKEFYEWLNKKVEEAIAKQEKEKAK